MKLFEVLVLTFVACVALQVQDARATFSEEAKETFRSKRASGDFQSADGCANHAFEDHALVLVPLNTGGTKKPWSPRKPRSVPPRADGGMSSHANESASENQKKYHRLAHSVHVQSDIRYRYATTLVTSQVRNSEEEAREVFLSVILPETAFISRFAIEVGGQLFVAFVKEKTQAWREYQEAVSKGQTAGHVGISARYSNHFRVSVNTQARTGVTFFLLYEELLQRRGGFYEHVINLTPRQKLRDFSIEVQVAEHANLSYLHVPELRRHEIVSREKSLTSLKDVDISRPSLSTAKIRYRPDLESLQRRLKSRHSLQFVVEYDVTRDLQKAGEIQVVDGFFVHFVAPEHLPPMPKHIVFVIDTSGSMMGKKMKQTKNALRTIIGELRERDHMTLLSFSDEVSTWDGNGNVIASVNEANAEAALEYVDGLEARGGTNLNDALTRALTIIAHVKHRGVLDKDVQPIIFFLTDGHATIGEVETHLIMDNVRKANMDTAIFTLAFGRSADFQLLKTLSLQNNGFARKIYVAADASLQLEGFYKEVSSPILRNVNFTYQTDEVLANSLTSTNFHTYYQGSEMVVAGKLESYMKDHPNELIEYEILATQALGDQYFVHGIYNGSEAHFYPQIISETIFDLVPQIRADDINFLERLWAYLTIKDLLEKVAKGELDSCQTNPSLERDANEPRAARDLQGQVPDYSTYSDDEDYQENGSGDAPEDLEQASEPLGPIGVADIMDEVGDADIIICSNLERALYLSLKYEFVTPLTSLVVVKPDVGEEFGDINEADQSSKSSQIHGITFSSSTQPSWSPVVLLLVILRGLVWSLMGGSSLA
eukprot:maker-scaffold589_size129586-snap-gene-0.49 protein:Tk07343 transcript:maker-scaffold589_size129586-snap-gene-0.49-mRNA-1 annotation:"inter-alpha-trypsin inhibitor heavy chain h4-like"